MIVKMNKMNTIGAATAAAIFALAASTSAQAGITGCSASGGKQEGGAVIGAVVGGLLGNAVGGRHATGETVVGAVAGAAAGSAIGCEAQKDRAKKRGYGASTYSRGGYKLSSQVRPANYERIGETFVAESTVNLRAAPSANSTRVGRLQAGQRFEAIAQVRNSDWILVGRNGVGIGYVRGDFVQPVSASYARS